MKHKEDCVGALEEDLWVAIVGGDEERL
jgi:hypothetical protein